MSPLEEAQFNLELAKRRSDAPSDQLEEALGILLKVALMVVLLVLFTGCAATPTVTQPCEAPVVPVQPDYPIYRLKSNAPNDVTAMAFYESFSMCRTHSDNLESLLNALKGRSQ